MVRDLKSRTFFMVGEGYDCGVSWADLLFNIAERLVQGRLSAVTTLFAGDRW